MDCGGDYSVLIIILFDFCEKFQLLIKYFSSCVCITVNIKRKQMLVLRNTDVLMLVLRTVRYCYIEHLFITVMCVWDDFMNQLMEFINENLHLLDILYEVVCVCVALFNWCCLIIGVD